MEHAAFRHKPELLFVCLCALLCGGCLTRKPPTAHPGPMAFAHPIVPAAISI